MIPTRGNLALFASFDHLEFGSQEWEAPVSSEEEAWHSRYSGMTARQLRGEMLVLAESLSRGIHDVGAPRLLANPDLLVLVEPGTEEDEPDLIYVARKARDGIGDLRLYLSREEFPELYALRDEVNWLNSEFLRRTTEENGG